MKNSDDEQREKLTKAAELRRRAEELIQHHPEHIEDVSADQIKAMVHELHVHEIELQMQNEEYERV